MNYGICIGFETINISVEVEGDIYSFIDRVDKSRCKNEVDLAHDTINTACSNTCLTATPQKASRVTNDMSNPIVIEPSSKEQKSCNSSTSMDINGLEQ